MFRLDSGRMQCTRSFASEKCATKQKMKMLIVASLHRGTDVTIYLAIKSGKKRFLSEASVSVHRRLQCETIALYCWVVTLIERGDHCAFHTSHQTWYAFYCCAGLVAPPAARIIVLLRCSIATNEPHEVCSFCSSNSEYDLNKLREQNEWICIG